MQPSVIRERMLHAKALIEQKRYDEARAILQTIDHPKAHEWLKKLDQISPNLATPSNIRPPLPPTIRSSGLNQAANADSCLQPILMFVLFIWWLYLFSNFSMGGFLILAVLTIVLTPSKKRGRKRRTEKLDSKYYQRIEQLDEMLSLDPVSFENYVGHLFKKMGYTVRTTAVTGDEGVDLFLRHGERKAIVQCKRYSGTVGQPVIRDLYGAMVHNRVDEAFLVTTGTISLPAQQWASGKPIHLIDGVALVEWVNSFEQQAVTSRSHYSSWKFRLGIVATILIVGVIVTVATNSAVKPADRTFPIMNSTLVPQFTMVPLTSITPLSQSTPHIRPELVAGAIHVDRISSSVIHASVELGFNNTETANAIRIAYDADENVLVQLNDGVVIVDYMYSQGTWQRLQPRSASDGAAATRQP